MRPSRDQWAMGLAQLTALRTTCCRRKVGAVLLNKRGHVLSTGYNGVAAGLPHCIEVIKSPVYHNDNRVVDVKDMWEFKGVKTPKFSGGFFSKEGNLQCVGFEHTHPYACPGANSPSGTNLDGCHAIHAEQNALLQCRDVYSIHTCYVTTAPCVTCCKLLLNTSCQHIVFLEEYHGTAAKELWLSAGRNWQPTTTIYPLGLARNIEHCS